MSIGLARRVLPALLFPWIALGQAPGGSGEDPRHENALAILRAKSVACHFHAIPFHKVVEHLRKETGVQIAVDPEVFERMDPEAFPLELILPETPALNVLDILLHLCSLDRTFQEGTLLVTLPEKAIGPPTLAVYDLQRLLHMPKWNPGEPNDLVQAYRGTEDAFSPFEGWGDMSTPEIAEYIREQVYPDSWDVRGCSLTTLPTAVVVNHGRKAHRAIRGLLRRLEGLRGPAVAFEVKVLRLPDVHLASIESFASLDDEDLATLERTSAGGDRREGSFRISCLNGARTHVASETEFLFDAGGGPGVLGAREGVVVDVYPMATEREVVPCEVRVLLKKRSTGAGGRPRLSCSRIRTSVRARRDRWIRCGTSPDIAPGDDKGRSLAVFLRAHAGPWTPADDAENIQAPADVRVRKALRGGRHSLDLKDTPLKAVIGMLREVSGLPFVLHPEVEEEVADEDLRFTLSVENETLGGILDRLTRPGDLAHWVRFGVVHVGLLETAPVFIARRRAFPVHDLLLAPAPDILRTGKGKALRWRENVTEPEFIDAIDGAMICAMVRELVDPGTWDRYPNSVTFIRNHLVVRIAERTAEKARALLSSIRSSVWKPVALEGIFLPARAVPSKHRVAPQAVLPAGECDGLEKGWRGAGEKERFRIRGVVGARLAASGGDQVVHRVGGEAEGDGSTRVRFDGWRFECCGVPGVGGGEVLLRVRAERSAPPPDAGSPAGLEGRPPFRFRAVPRIRRGGGVLLGAEKVEGTEGPEWFLYLRVR
ncbi:MAG: hypothetical protein ACYS47_09680 [Planctomycetota bacterium]|jgi:hypothetical protein